MCECVCVWFHLVQLGKNGAQNMCDPCVCVCVCVCVSLCVCVSIVCMCVFLLRYFGYDRMLKILTTIVLF